MGSNRRRSWSIVNEVKINKITKQDIDRLIKIRRKKNGKSININHIIDNRKLS
jgi:hypothetical protein